MDLVVISLFFGGGLVLAVVLLLCATFSCTSFIGRLILAVLALLSLAAQGGCWYVAVGIGRATGSTGDSGTMFSLVVLAAIAAIIWSVVLLTNTAGRKVEVPPTASGIHESTAEIEGGIEDNDPDAAIKRRANDGKI